MPAENTNAIYQLKVTLKYIKPPIWRRLQVRGDITLYKLHQVLQVAFGWWDSHLHQSIVDDVYYGVPHPDFGMEVKSERRVRLYEIVQGVKSKFTYEYDFGDGWLHEIMVEDILAPDSGTRYPRCLKGKRHRPPEDVGGPWGYEHFLEAIRDPKHEEHEDYLEWIGGSFDPEAFDLAEVNEGLKDIK